MSPIRPENLARYPADWPRIRARILLRSGNRCERCGIPNNTLGGRCEDGTFLDAEPIEEKLLKLVWPMPGEDAVCSGDGRREKLRIIRIVLTIAHLDHTPENCSDENLQSLCQRCHLLYDADHHAQTRYQTRREGKALGDMFEETA